MPNTPAMHRSAFSPSCLTLNLMVRPPHAHVESLRGSARWPRACASQLSHHPARPLPQRRRHFLNLSNGLEAAAAVAGLAGLDRVRVTRLQSSHCEAQAYDAVLRSLGPELLFSLAAGYKCYVYDLGSRDSARGVPRALFLGLQFVKWALAYLWFGDTADVVLVRGKNVAEFWRDFVMPYKIDKKTKKMIRYYSAFAEEMGVRQISLFGVYGRITEIDGRKDAYARIVKDVWGCDVGMESSEEEERRFEEWLTQHEMCMYDTESSAEELVQRQLWMRDVKEKT